ncbi:MAG: class I SAM-dependent methyltransferase [Candidatus Sericytochromatia bacterium]
MCSDQPDNLPEDRELAALLRRPQGPDATLIAERMSQNNAHLIQQSYALLAPTAGERLLELGCGNGAWLNALSTALGEEGAIWATDYSPEMLTEVRRLQHTLVAQGRLHLQEATLPQLPFANGFFDAAVSNNTLYFWDQALDCARELKRVLRPGGRLALGIRSRAVMAKLSFSHFGFAHYSPAEALQLLENAGFELLDLRRRMTGPVDSVTLLVQRPESA